MRPQSIRIVDVLLEDEEDINDFMRQQGTVSSVRWLKWDSGRGSPVYFAVLGKYLGSDLKGIEFRVAGGRIEITNASWAVIDPESETFWRPVVQSEINELDLDAALERARTVLKVPDSLKESEEPDINDFMRQHDIQSDSGEWLVHKGGRYSRSYFAVAGRDHSEVSGFQFIVRQVDPTTSTTKYVGETSISTYMIDEWEQADPAEIKKLGLDAWLAKIKGVSESEEDQDINDFMRQSGVVGQVLKKGAGGWPIVTAPQYRDGVALACPKCWGTQVIMSFIYTDRWHTRTLQYNECGSCGHKEFYK
jgi:hypothetical protein